MLASRSHDGETSVETGILSSLAMMTAAVESPSTSKAGASVVPAPLVAVGRCLTAADHVRVGAS
ncbi:MAG: hypothetical protein ACKOIZ_03640, partial [Actinomycetota bacterium]